MYFKISKSGAFLFGSALSIASFITARCRVGFYPCMGQLGFRAGDSLFLVLNASPGKTESGRSFLDLPVDGAHIAREVA